MTSKKYLSLDRYFYTGVERQRAVTTNGGILDHRIIGGYDSTKHMKCCPYSTHYI